MANKKNFKMQAYEILKRKILANEFKPNEYLEEKNLCEMVNMSRTPIREAINLLAQENLVTVIQNKGVFVSELGIQSVRELFEARHTLEPIILQKAFSNLDFDVLIGYKKAFDKGLEDKDYPRLHQLDYEFHNYIHSCCQNSFLSKTMATLSDQFQRVRTQSFYSKERTENGAHEHLQLIELIMQGKREQAAAFLDKHIGNTEKYYFQSLI